MNTHFVYRSESYYPIKALMTVHLVRRNARSIPWAGEEALAPIGEQDSTDHDIDSRTSKSSSPSKEPGSRILRGYCGAKVRLISYQAHGPRRGGRNAQGRIKGIKIAKIYCRGRPCPRQTKITEGESATPLEAVLSSILKEVSSPMG